MADEHYWIALSSLKTEFPDVPVKEIQALMDKYRKGNKDLTTLGYTCAQFSLSNPNKEVLVNDRYVSHIIMEEGKGNKISLLETPEERDYHGVDVIHTTTTISFGSENILSSERKEVISLKPGNCVCWWLEFLPDMKLEERRLVLIPPNLGFPTQWHAQKMNATMEDWIKINVKILKIKD